MDLQSGERACCRNTGGERLRQALTAADETLSKQVQPQICSKILRFLCNLYYLSFSYSSLIKPFFFFGDCFIKSIFNWIKTVSN